MSLMASSAPSRTTTQERAANLRSTVRFVLRMTVSALAAFSLVQVVQIPLHGLWAVLTAVIVTQASTGGSIRASFEYLLGTLLGALYATVVSLIIPHASPVLMGVALALAVGPLAIAAASSAVFRVAPFTAVVVLLLGTEFGQGPAVAATTRFLEVALGGGVAVVVSLLVLPEGAHSRGRQVAAGVLERLASALPMLLRGLAERSDPAAVQRVQDDLGAAIAAFDAAVAEAKHEQTFGLAARTDAAPLSRTMLRLRHDLVIVGRAGAAPLPGALSLRLGPPASAVGAEVGGYLAAAALTLGERRPPPDLGSVGRAFDGFVSAVAALRAEGVTRALSTGELEQLFALGFAFEQMRQDLADLERCLRDWAAF